MIDGGVAPPPITAIVHAVDGVRFVATGDDPEAVVSRLADYVCARCDHVLWADAASDVRAMLDIGNLYGAVMLYFERVGERWDDERLELVTLDGDRARWTFHEEMMAYAR